MTPEDKVLQALLSVKTQAVGRDDIDMLRLLYIRYILPYMVHVTNYAIEINNFQSSEKLLLSLLCQK